MSILNQIQQKIKHLEISTWIDSAMWIAIIFFIALGSFSLGINYERNNFREQNPINVQYNQAAVDLWNEYNQSKYLNTEFFASKNGSVVYPIGCSKGDRVKEENRVFFTEIDQAIDLGYRLVTGC